MTCPRCRNNLRILGRSYCGPCKKMYDKEYRRTSAGKATSARSFKRYGKTLKGKAAIARKEQRYRKSPKGKVSSLKRQQRYRNTTQGKLVRAEGQRRYLQTSKGRMYILRFSNLRRARKANAPGFVTAEQLQARIDFYGGLCAYCSRSYECIDHVIPLSRGGSNWPANLMPACKSCNSSKGDKTLEEWKVCRGFRQVA